MLFKKLLHKKRLLGYYSSLKGFIFFSIKYTYLFLLLSFVYYILDFYIYMPYALTFN